MTSIESVATRACDTVRFTVGECALGAILVAMSDKHIRVISLGDDRETLTGELRDELVDADLSADDGGMQPVLAEVIAFVEDPAGWSRSAARSTWHGLSAAGLAGAA